MEEKTALLGIHDCLAGIFDDFLKFEGYLVDLTYSSEEMLEKVRQKEYNVYVMDVNLGNPNTNNITPAIEVYNLVKLRVEKGLAKFVTISGNWDAVKIAQKQGIPAERKGCFSLLKFLEEEIKTSSQSQKSL